MVKTQSVELAEQIQTLDKEIGALSAKLNAATIAAQRAAHDPVAFKAKRAEVQELTAGLGAARDRAAGLRVQHDRANAAEIGPARAEALAVLSRAAALCNAERVALQTEKRLVARVAEAIASRQDTQESYMNVALEKLRGMTETARTCRFAAQLAWSAAQLGANIPTAVEACSVGSESMERFATAAENYWREFFRAEGSADRSAVTAASAAMEEAEARCKSAVVSLLALLEKGGV